MNQTQSPSTRRQFLKSLSALAAVSAAPSFAFSQASTQPTPIPSTQPVTDFRYKISVCDWMLLKRQKLGAFKWAKDCGYDGVEVDMGRLSTNPTFENELAKDEVRADFLKTSKESGVAISSLAMSGMYAWSIAKRDMILPVTDTVKTMKQMNVKIAFLPLGIQGDLVKYPEQRPKAVETLKQIGEIAQKAGVILGIETALDAAGDIKLLEDVDCPAIRIYFNFANADQAKRDLISELKTLGKDRICQIHCTLQDKFNLQDDPRIDMPKVKQTLDEMGWSGWLVVERSRAEGHGRDVKYNFGRNAEYLKRIFQNG